MQYSIGKATRVAFSRFRSLRRPNALSDSMSPDLHASLQAFHTRFGGAKASAIVRAPGRVNLIGEHVDYNEGFVLPIAIGRSTIAVVGTSDDSPLRFYSSHEDETLEFDARHPP